jgi:hypothetical protein
MGLFDGVSQDLTVWSRSSINTQLGGGCPICKGENTLDRRREGGKYLLVCEKCGAAFDNAFFSGLKLVRGDRRYRDQTLPAGVWRIIRLLPETDRLLAAYSHGRVTYYATLSGVIRVKGQEAALLKYRDVKNIDSAAAWMPSAYHIVGGFLFFASGFLSILLALAASLYVSLVFAVVFFCIGAGVVFVSRKRVYQFDSDLFSKKEFGQWRIPKSKTKDEDEFISIVKEHL